MRTIASTSGAEITGITINDYQVKRGEYHNGKVTVVIQRGLWQACVPQIVCERHSQISGMQPRYAS